MDKVISLIKTLSFFGLHKESSRAASLLAEGFKFLAESSESNIKITVVSPAGKEIGWAEANRVGDDIGVECINLILGLEKKRIWQQHRYLNDLYRGMGLGRETLIKLHEEIESRGGIVASYGMVSDAAIENNIERLSGYFDLMDIVVIDSGMKKIFFASNDPDIITKLESLGIKVSEKGALDIGRAVSRPYWSNRSSGLSVKSGLLIRRKSAT